MIRGFSQSGKDYIGKILCNEHGYRRFAFADPLKKIVAAKYNCSIDVLHSQSGKLQICENDALNRTFREILIDEALILQNQDIDIFAQKCCEDITTLYRLNKDVDIVITDWRYQNELDLIIQSFPESNIITVCVKNIHQSKSPIDDISEYNLIDRKNDYLLINNLDDSIYREVDNLIKYISLNS